MVAAVVAFIGGALVLGVEWAQVPSSTAALVGNGNTQAQAVAGEQGAGVTFAATQQGKVEGWVHTLTLSLRLCPPQPSFPPSLPPEASLPAHAFLIHVSRL